MSNKEVLSLIEKEFESVSDWAHSDNGFVEGLGHFEVVDRYGGEGRGEVWYSVKYFKEKGIYVRVDGYYSSYHGTDFEDGYGEIVSPVERLVTFYE